MSVTFWTKRNEDGVNLSNGNADDLMRFIGLTPDYSGTVKARDLVVLTGRALIRPAGAADPGREETREQLPGGALVIHCERRPGYLIERARQLHDMALGEAKSDGDVHWG